MNKEQQKYEIILAVKEAFNDNAEPTPFVREYIELDGNDIDHIAEQTAETLYNASYRKTFTSDFASDTQKAYKEGYLKGFNSKLTSDFVRFAQKQAVEEFAEKCKERIDADYVNGMLNNHRGHLTEYDIDELIKEFER